MKNSGRYIAKIRFPNHTGGISWVLLEYDRHQTQGWYLYGYKDSEEASVFDSWHATKEEAIGAAIRDLGIQPTDWQKAIQR